MAGTEPVSGSSLWESAMQIWSVLGYSQIHGQGLWRCEFASTVSRQIYCRRKRRELGMIQRSFQACSPKMCLPRANPV